MADDPKHIVRSGALDGPQAWRGRHPFNPNSDMRIARLADQAGMSRVGVNMIRIPPGRESFIAHAHRIQEEFIFILEGAGDLTLDGAVHRIGPGDFVGFPTDGVVHGLTSVGPGDLVYLSGGERTAVEVAEMPTLGKVQVIAGGKFRMCGEDGIDELSVADWMARTALPPEA